MKRWIKSKKIWLVTISLLLIFIFWPQNQKAPILIPEFTLPVSTSETVSPPVKLINSVKTQELPSSHTQCKSFNERYTKVYRVWQDNFQENAGSWLAQGFSSIEVAYAIEHFRNRNFAQNWLIKQQIRNARVTKENKTLREQFSLLIGKALPDYYHISQEFPRKHLKGFQTMTASQRQKAINTAAPTVDDIAAFINSNELDHTAMLELLEQLINPKEIIASAGITQPIYLLEYSIAYGNYQLADALLNLGVLPKNDAYLKNALEQILESVYFGSHGNNDIASHIAMVKKLIDLGLTARHQLLADGSIKSRSAVFNYEFDSVKLMQWQETYDLDLISVAAPKLDRKYSPSGRLITLLEEKKQAYLSQAYENFPFAQARQECVALENEISNVWKQPIIVDYSIIQPLKDKYQGDMQAVRAELAIRDPDYSDCLADMENLRAQNLIDNNEYSQSYYKNVHSNNLQLSIDFFQSRQLSLEEQTQAFYLSLRRFGANKSRKLLDLGIVPSYLDYSLLDWQKLTADDLEFFSSQGFDMLTIDKQGKTALYFAVKYKRADLIKFFNQAKYPFYGQSPMQDPLHLLLASWKRDYQESSVIELLTELMKFSPEIDSFHLARMKLLKLRDNKFYLQLVEKFPELTPQEETPYPDAACW